jgi:hypothetical protein
MKGCQESVPGGPNCQGNRLHELQKRHRGARVGPAVKPFAFAVLSVTKVSGVHQN